MKKEDPEALLCDFAQYYRIYDLDEFDLVYIGILAAGLPDESRSNMRISKEKAPINTLLLASQVDLLSLLIWSLSGGKGKRPRLVTDSLTEKESVSGFDSGKDFKKKWSEIVKNGKEVENGD